MTIIGPAGRERCGRSGGFAPIAIGRAAERIIPFRNEVVVKVLIWGEGGSGWKLGDVDRLRLLWLLKSGSVRSLGGAAAVLGYSERQVQRWWACYAAGGLAALVQRRRRGGSRERISAAAWAALNARLRAGEIARLKDAQAYLREQWGIVYCLDALSKLFRRHKVKRKTGRPRHRRADAAAQAAFKKSVRRHA